MTLSNARRLLGSLFALGIALGVLSAWPTFFPVATAAYAQSSCTDVATVSCSPTNYLGLGDYAVGGDCMNVTIENMLPSNACSWSCANSFIPINANANFHGSFTGIDEGTDVGAVQITFLDSDTFTTRVAAGELIFHPGTFGMPAWVGSAVKLPGSLGYGPLRIKIKANEYPLLAAFTFDPSFIAARSPGTEVRTAWVSLGCIGD